MNPSPQTSQPELLHFNAVNVTGTQAIEVDFGPQLSARAVTESIAHRMQLPSDVAWSLRDDSVGAFLDEDRAIGDQIEPGANVSVTPRAHLGGGEQTRV
jgi:hypothetical protein